jgi:hypothetical protein
MVYKDDLANIIEGRILAEKRKHPTSDWIKIASLKIADDIIEVKGNLKPSDNNDFKASAVKPQGAVTGNADSIKDFGKFKKPELSPKPCPSCKGTGYDKNEYTGGEEPCFECLGQGFIKS